MATPASQSADPADTPERVFRWQEVAPADLEWLRRRTEDVLGLSHRSARDAIRIGEALCEVQKRLPRKFHAWMRTQTPLSPRTGNRLMAISRTFSAYLNQAEQFSLCALYILSEQDTPVAARGHAVQLAESGQKVTRALALEILDAHREVEVEGEFVRDYERVKKEIFKEENQQDKQTVLLSGREHQRLVAIGRAVELVVSRESIVSIARIAEEETVQFSITVHGNQHGPQNFFGTDLKCILQEISGEVETKYCPKCNETKPITEFGANASLFDGLMARCSHCENQRKIEKKQAAKTAHTAEPTHAG